MNSDIFHNSDVIRSI